jgi:hypothetical protein
LSARLVFRDSTTRFIEGNPVKNEPSTFAHEIGFLPAAVCTIAALLAGCATQQQGLAIDELQQVKNLAACYTEGIDAIGAGKVDAGTSIWGRCFAEDVTISMSFGPAYSVTCPGEKCPLPATMTGLARRVALARGTYERAGYVMTSHHVTTIGVERIDTSAARLKGHLQAWHFRKDGTAVLGLGTWEIEARKTPAGWRIVDEKLESPLRVVIPKAELPKTD